MVDGFGLPETDDEDKQLRSKVLDLIQALESQGITTILVEEAGVRAEGWLPFVVDVVFELDLAADPDTGDLLRQLRCPKSRYAVALPGPHDYGIDVDGDFGVWPDLTLAADMRLSLDAEGEHEGTPAPAIFIPFKDGEAYALLPAGSVMVSHVSKPEAFTVHKAVAVTAGVQVATVWCGPLTTVDYAKERVTLSQSQGVFALAWLLIAMYRAGQINVVTFNSVEFWLEHPRSRIRLLRATSMLSSAGLTVCIDGQKGRLAMLDPIADYVQDGRWRKSIVVRPPARLQYPADRWLMVHSELASLECALPQPERTAMGPAESALLSGDGLDAAKRATALTEEPTFIQFWFDLTAIYAGNRYAIALLQQRASAADPRATIMLLRALIRHGPRETFEQLLGDCKQWFALPEWYHARLRRELELDAPDQAGLPEIIAELEQLAESDQVPQRHRAEILYNLSTVASRQGDQARASELAGRAAQLEPEV